MIDEKKLLCAFIYSAYESGYCGLMLKKDEKQEHMKLYRDYIKNESYYPEKEIEATQKKMMDSVKSSSVRDYIYGSHKKVVVERIEKTIKPFESAIKGDIILGAALNCPVNFYKVITLEKGIVFAENIVSGTKKNLELLAGLETPKKGDIISGHWKYFLEILNGWNDLDKYLGQSKKYFERIRNAREN